MERLLNTITIGQRGLITYEQARDVGLTAEQIEHRVRRGVWIAAAPRVFRIAGVPVDDHAMLLAVVLASDGAASHRSAAALTRLLKYMPAKPEIVLPVGQRFTGPAVVYRSTDLAPTDITYVDGIRTTNAVRTLLDLGARVPLPVLEDAFHRAIREGLVDYDLLVARFFQIARRGRNGCGPMRAILTEYDPTMAPAESSLETRLLRILREFGLPAPVRQFEVVVRGQKFRLDVAYPDEHIAIEGDGFGVHAERHMFERDRERQNLLVLDGWLMLRFTWRQLCGRPEWVASQVREARALRAA